MNRAGSAQESRTGGKSRVLAMVGAENRESPSRALTEGASDLRCGSGLCDCNQGRECPRRVNRVRVPGWLLMAAFVAYAALILYAWPDLVAWRDGEPPVMIGGER